jgi:hypothetical protein
MKERSDQMSVVHTHDTHDATWGRVDALAPSLVSTVRNAFLLLAIVTTS